MIKLNLTPKQRTEVKGGAAFVMLNETQAKYVRGKLTASSKVPSCVCGQCDTCKARERKRLQRANAKSPKGRKAVPKNA